MADGMSLPAVLVTNDDGIDAPGIRALVAVLGESRFCNVYVCAPDMERSAIGHGISVRETLEANLQEDYEGADAAYALSGTPADCASLGISTELFGPNYRPALVVSGINKGANTGVNCIYSGTVAGAREAHMCGIPAFALSLDWGSGSSDALFRPAAAASLPLIRAAVQASLDGVFPMAFFLNVNIPLQPDTAMGRMLTTQGKARVRMDWVRSTARRTGQQVASWQPGGGELPAASRSPGVVPGGERRGIGLPGMAGGRGGVPLPGMASPNLKALAQFASAAAAKGAVQSHEEAESVGEEVGSKPTAYRQQLHFRRSVVGWESPDTLDTVDTVALANGYITITPLSILTDAPSLERSNCATWLSDLLT